jgi:hypothetical protein
LDTRQYKRYKIKDLPIKFNEGYKLSDSIDKKYKKGEHAPSEER